LAAATMAEKCPLNLQAQLTEGWNSASLSPRYPLMEGIGNLLWASLERQPEPFLYQIDAIKPRVRLRQKLELRPLVLRQMLWVFEQDIAEILHCIYTTCCEIQRLWA